MAMSTSSSPHNKNIFLCPSWEKRWHECIKSVGKRNCNQNCIGLLSIVISLQNKVDLKLLMKALRDYTDIRQLTPEIVNALIRRIEVHSKDKKTKKVKVDIYFTAVGLFTPPTEQELQMTMEEIRRNPQQFGISA